MYPIVSAKIGYNKSDTEFEVELLNPFEGYTYTDRVRANPAKLEEVLSSALLRVRKLRDRIDQ